MISADKVLTEHQLNKLLKKLRVEKEKSVLSISNGKGSAQDKRAITDYFLFTVLSSTGLRISEALNLKWSDIHEDFLIVRAEISKNHNKGTVYFGPKTQSVFKDLRALKETSLKRTNTDLLFSYSGKIPSRSYAHTRFKMWLKYLDLPKNLSIHCLRHTYGTICLDKGLPLTFVRDQLRHSNIAITSQYLHLTKESRDRVKEFF